MVSIFDGFQEYSREIQRRIRLEFRIELPLLRARWKQVLFGALFQYVHGMATQLAHRMHQPQEVPLGDIGFTYLPELGLENAWVSETIFWCLFIPFILWSFSPFVTARKRFYTAVIYARILVVLSLCQLLRIISFTVTQLPAPNYHCREGESTAVRDMPTAWWGHVVVDVGRQATHGCGDLIFSSHTTFVLVGVLTYTEYGQRLLIKIIAWIGVGMMSTCIVASRKHYTVDVVVAWYTVPLVFFAMHRRWTTKRPVQDYWPHRPLGGEEGVEPSALDAAALDMGMKGESTKPLLPIVTANNHSRQGSRSTNDLRGLLGKPPLQPVKEPASPPPPPLLSSSSKNMLGALGMMNGGGGGIMDPGNGNAGVGGVAGNRAQRRQNSATTGYPAVAELEMRDLEGGGGGGGGTGVGGGGSSSRESPTGSSPPSQLQQQQQQSECSIM